MPASRAVTVVCLSMLNCIPAETTLTVVRGLGRALLCLSVCLSVVVVPFLKDATNYLLGGRVYTPGKLGVRIGRFGRRQRSFSAA